MACTHKSHDVTRMSQACKISSNAIPIIPQPDNIFTKTNHSNPHNHHRSQSRSHLLGPTKRRIQNKPPLPQQAYGVPPMALTAPQGSISFNAIYKKHGKQTFQRSHSLHPWPRHQPWSSARIPPPLVRNSKEGLCELIPFSRGMRGTLWHSERGLGGIYRRLVADMHVGWEIVIAECEVSGLEDTF